MPSTRSLSGLAVSAFGASQAVLHPGGPDVQAYDYGASETCRNTQLSCHNTSVVENLCCFNAPGGTLLQTQFWDTHPATGPTDSWTIHGLWPDNCDGSYDANCDDARAYTNITSILRSFGANDLLTYMKEYWVSDSGSSETFWEHEWSKHGTCISTLNPTCYPEHVPTQEVPDYFHRAVNLFKSLPSYEWLKKAGITPSTSARYTKAEIESALTKHHGGQQVYLGCRSGALTEIWYFFNVKGSIQHGAFEPTDVVGASSSCPGTGIRYLPKSSGSSPTRSHPSGTTTRTAAPTSTGPPFSGAGYLNVITSGRKEGCLISRGTWYKSGTCATYHANSTGDDFTLRSTKGDCAISSDGALTCGPTIQDAASFTARGKKLLYSGEGTFHADRVPRGFKQESVYVKGHHLTSLEIEWQSR